MLQVDYLGQMEPDGDGVEVPSVDQALGTPNNGRGQKSWEGPRLAHHERGTIRETDARNVMSSS